MNPERAAKLQEKMLAYQLFVIFWQGKGKDLMPLLAEHLDYMIELERSGKLFASGPLGLREMRNGMTVLRAETIEEARAIALADPFVKADLRGFTVEPWTIMEGSITVSVSYSDGSMTVR